MTLQTLNTENLRPARLAIQVQFFVNGMLFATWGVHIPIVKALFNLDERALSALMLAMGIGALISLSRVGGWVARHGTHKVVLIGGLLTALALAGLVQMPGYPALISDLLLFGLASGAFDVAMNAEASAVELAYGRPIMSSFHGFFSLGGLAGSVLGGLSIAQGVPPSLYLIGISVAGFAMIWVSGFVRLPASRHANAEETNGGFTLPGRPILLLGMLAALGLIGEGAMYDWSTLYMVKILASPPQIAALGYGAFSAAMACGRFGGDNLRARIGANRALSFSAWLAAVAMGATLIINQTWAALLGFAFVGLGFSNIIPVLFSAAAKVPGISAASGIAGVSGMGYLAFMMGPPLIGAIAHAAGLPIAMSVVVAAAATTAALAHRAMNSANR